MRKGVIILGLVAGVVGLAAGWLAGSYLIAPTPSTLGAPPPDLPAETVSWVTSDDRPIKGWFVPGIPGRGAIILLHQLRANRRPMLGRAKFLNRAGYSVLMFDFQGHGETPGENPDIRIFGGPGRNGGCWVP